MQIKSVRGLPGVLMRSVRIIADLLRENAAILVIGFCFVVHHVLS